MPSAKTRATPVEPSIADNDVLAVISVVSVVVDTTTVCMLSCFHDSALLPISYVFVVLGSKSLEMFALKAKDPLACPNVITSPFAINVPPIYKSLLTYCLHKTGQMLKSSDGDITFMLSCKTTIWRSFFQNGRHSVLQ